MGWGGKMAAKALRSCPEPYKKEHGRNTERASLIAVM